MDINFFFGSLICRYPQIINTILIVLINQPLSIELQAQKNQKSKIKYKQGKPFIHLYFLLPASNQHQTNPPTLPSSKTQNFNKLN